MPFFFSWVIAVAIVCAEPALGCASKVAKSGMRALGFEPVSRLVDAGSTTVTYAHGVTVRFDGRDVYIQFPNSKNPVHYPHAERDLGAIRASDYPQSLLSPHNLKGLRVLFGACGPGKHVQQAREEGIDAYGMAAVLAPEEMADHLFEGELTETGFYAETFDLVVLSFAPTSAFAESADVKLAVIEEARRILTPQGRILIAPISSKSFRSILYPRLKGLKLLSGGESRYVELQKVRTAGEIAAEYLSPLAARARTLLKRTFRR